MLVEEYEEGYNLECLTRYTRQDHLKGWDVYRILDEIKHLNFVVLDHLLNEILDLKAEQDESDSSSDPSLNAPGESSTTAKGKEVAKGNPP